MEHAGKWIEKRWTDDPFERHDTLVAEFRIPAGVDSSPPGIWVEFFWSQNSTDRYKLEIGVFNEKTRLSHTFANGVILEGWLKWLTLFECSENENGGIFGNIHLCNAGREERWHYEGMMVIFHWGGIVPPGPLPPPGPSPSPGPGPPMEIVSQSEELFPYIYMRAWPRISDRDMELHFVDYVGGPFPAGPLYTQLAALRDSGDRAAMEQLAVKYINGDTGWLGQFVDDVFSLPGIWAHFPELEKYARDLHDHDLDQVIVVIGEILHLPEEQWKAYLASADYLAALNRVQDSYFALVITLGYDQWDLRILTTTLVTANLFAALIRDRQFFTGPAVFRHMSRASIILPRTIFPLPPYLSSPPSQPVRKGWIEPYAIGDLQMVRHRLMRYQPGEIAAITNVLKGERREIKSRNLQMASESVLDESLVDKLLDREDLAGRSNLIAATEKTIADTVVVTDYDKDKGFKTTYGPPSTVTFEGSWSVEKKEGDGEPAKDDVSRFARNILNRTVNRVSQQIHRVRLASSTHENEETVVSVFDNVGGASNIRGIYRWLNKVYRVSVVHYGTRLMIEFLLKDPAERYILKELNLRGINYVEPLPPEHFKIRSYADVTPDNYASLAAYYGVTELDPPPLATRIVSTVLTANQTSQISLPQGYQAEKAEVRAAFPEQTDQLTLNGLLGIEPFTLSAKESGMALTMNRELEAVPVSLTSLVTLTSPPTVAGDCYLNVEIVCVPTAAEWERWQIATYGVLLKGYHRRKNAYYQQTSSRNGGTTIPARSSLACRRIERSVLRKGCMGLLLARRQGLVGTPPTPNPSPFSVNEPRYLQFFENAFEWREMTYDFSLDLDDGEAHGGSWANISDMAGDDELFARFLQAGQARVMVPTSPEYTRKVLYYLSSAMIMPGANDMTPVHYEDISIVDELQKIRKDSIGGDLESASWEVVVPTTMQVLQESNELPGDGMEDAQ